MFKSGTQEWEESISDGHGWLLVQQELSYSVGHPDNVEAMCLFKDQ